MIHDAAAQIAGIGVLAIVCQWLGWRLKLPAIVFLLIAGMIAGPVTGWLQPDALFGDLLFPLVSLCVAVILFEGALSLRFAEISGVENVVVRLVTWGTLISWFVTTAATMWLSGATNVRRRHERQGARVYQHQASVDVARLEVDCNLLYVHQS